MQQATGAAAITVLKLMTDTNVPRQSDSGLLSAFSIKRSMAVQFEDIDARVSQLERAAKERKDSLPPGNQGS
jgi:hypothetical protein